MHWWQEFFDETYRKLWSHLHPPEDCQADAQSLMRVLGLQAGDRLLDAPCGYGRVTLPLARQGLHVTGLDFSAELLKFAQQGVEREGLTDRICLVRADLRNTTLHGGFKAAINLFSSIGYGSEEEDEEMMCSIFEALDPGGKLFLETMHRDAVVTRHAQGVTTGIRGPDGITLREKNRFDPVSGKLHSRWTWNSPTTSGSRSSVIRLYSATELVALLRRAGFASVQCRAGISEEAFTEASVDSRLGLLCTKADSCAIQRH